MRTPQTQQRGAVLLLALLAAALLAGVVMTTLWRQSGLIQIETAQRQHQQAQWLLIGAFDWARLILREDARTGAADHLSEPWAVTLQESRLSSFLAQSTERMGTDADQALAEQVFLSGRIEDAQGKFNLNNLVQGQVVDRRSRQQWLRLLDILGLPLDSVDRLTQQWLQTRQQGGTLWAPRKLDDLLAWGYDASWIERLRPHVTVLPEPTPLNVNTASAEVLAASMPEIDLPRAQRLVLERARQPWTQAEQARQALGSAYDDTRMGIGSRYFLIHGQLRMSGMQTALTALVKRDGPNLVYQWVQPGNWAGAL